MKKPSRKTKPRNPKTFRSTEDEDRNIALLKKAGVSKTNSGIIHKALDRGFMVLKVENGIIPVIQMMKNNEEVKA